MAEIIKRKLIDDTVKEICEDKCKLGYRYVSNITDKQNSIKKIKAAMMLCAKALASTLGPSGSTTIVQSQDGRHLVTKDGLDVISSIRFSDPVANIVLDQLRSIARNQVRLVGDGSTSAIIIANALYQAITDLDAGEFSAFSGKDIVDILSVLADYFEKKIIELSKPVSEDLHEIELIAKISTNNDMMSGNVIKEVFNNIGPYGFVKTDTATAFKEDTIEYVTGLAWDRGYIDGHFGNDVEEGIVKYEQPKVFICRGRLDETDMQMLSHVIGSACGANVPTNANQGKLIIIATAYSDDIKIFLQNNRHMSAFKTDRTDFQITALDIDCITRKNTDLIDNLAILSGAIIYDKNKQLNTNDIILSPEKYLGSVKYAVITRNDTNIVTDDKYLTPDQLKAKAKVIEDIEAKINELENTSDYNVEHNTEVFYLKYKLSALTKSSAIYHVGGLTNEERISRERLIEDALYAAQSALKHGYIFGGNLAIPLIIKNNFNEIITLLQNKFDYLTDLKFNFKAFVNNIANAFKESYYLVLNNSSLVNIDDTINKCLDDNLFFNLKIHKFEDLNNTQVINSVATDIEIMKSCFSIIGMLSTSNQIVTTMLNQEM